MTELKREAISLIESIPDENSALLNQIVKNLRGLIDDAKRQRKQISRVEQNIAVMEEIETLVGEGGDDVTALKQEVIALIENIPDEKADVLVKIRKSIRELLGINSKSRAEKNLAIMNEITNLIGDDIPWRNEDEMIRDTSTKRSRHG